MKEETSTKLDKMKDTKCEYGYAIRCAIPICVMPPFIIPSGTAVHSGLLSKGAEIGSGSRNYEFYTGYPNGNMIDMISLLTFVTPILSQHNQI